MAILIVGSVFLALVAVVLTSQVSAGPTVMGGAILLAVYARIIQAQPKVLPTAALRCTACGHRNPVGPAVCEKCGAALKGAGSEALHA